MPSSINTPGRFFALAPWKDERDGLAPADGLTNAEVRPVGVLSVGDGTLAGALLVDGASAGMLLVRDGTPTTVLLVKDGTSTGVLAVGDGIVAGVCTGVADENVEVAEGWKVGCPVALGTPPLPVVVAAVLPWQEPTASELTAHDVRKHPTAAVASPQAFSNPAVKSPHKAVTLETILSSKFSRSERIAPDWMSLKMLAALSMVSSALLTISIGSVCNMPKTLLKEMMRSSGRFSMRLGTLPSWSSSMNFLASSALFWRI